MPAVAVLWLGWLPVAGQAQQDSLPAPDSWWKGLFRVTEMPACQPDSTGIDTSTDSVGNPNLELDGGLDSVRSETWPMFPPASFAWNLPEGLAQLDSLDKAEPAPLQGYRIQIYFGDLQEARSVRAAFRRDHPDVACQLLPISPNYAVTVGNYRDLWSAQRALRDGEIGSWKLALVIPSPIDLPALR